MAEWWDGGVGVFFCFYLHDEAFTFIGLALGVCIDAANLLLLEGSARAAQRKKARRKEGGRVWVEGREEQLLAPATSTKQHGRSHE